MYNEPDWSSLTLPELLEKAHDFSKQAYSKDFIPISGILEPRPKRVGRESMRYADVSRKKRKLLNVTTITVEEFEQLVPVFEEEFQERMKKWRLDGKERTERRYTTYANCPLPTSEDRLLFILVYLKTNNLQEIHGELFAMSQGKANQWIHTLLPVLQSAFSKLGDAPTRSMQELAQRWGLNALPDLSSLVPDKSVAADEIPPSMPDSSHTVLN